jgi:hypothetical protein
MIEKVFAKGNVINVVVKGVNILTHQAMGGTGTEANKEVVTHVFKASHVFGSVSCTALFLPYMPNGINYTSTYGLDVISGPFSGCWMASYLRGGYRCICHVATPECNNTWNAIKALTQVTKEFKPADPFMNNPTLFTKKLAGGSWYMMGVITAEDKCYSILLTDVGETLRKTGKDPLGRPTYTRKDPSKLGQYKVVEVWKR